MRKYCNYCYVLPNKGVMVGKIHDAFSNINALVHTKDIQIILFELP